MINKYSFAQAFAIATNANYIKIREGNKPVASLPSGCSAEVFSLNIADNRACYVTFNNNVCVIDLI